MVSAHASGQSSRSPGLLVDTLIALVSRELRIRYKGSFFGVLWAVLSPLATVAILNFVFTRVIPLEIPNYAAFLYSGLLPWVWFQSSVHTAASALVDNRDLVRTPFFAKALLPGVVTATNFLLYCFALPVLLLLIATDGVSLTPALAALPVVWLVQGILTLGFSVLVAGIAVVVRDVQHLLGVLLLFWFYLTPVFYDTSAVPPEWAGWMALNPMAAIVSAHRAVTVLGTFPDWRILFWWAIAGVALLAFSLRAFHHLDDAFIEKA
jgi:lipopolysaccharide transport system permease protein